jgi:hypothetical protein
MFHMDDYDTTEEDYETEIEMLLNRYVAMIATGRVCCYSSYWEWQKRIEWI